MCSNQREKLQGPSECCIHTKTEDDLGETNFELYLMKKSSSKNKKRDLKKRRKCSGQKTIDPSSGEERKKTEEGDIAQDSVPKFEIQERVASLTHSKERNQELPPKGGANVPQSFVDVPDYGFAGLDGGYQAPY
ncbi:hypothetical protein JTB14_009465 [Gonioctena quinquepunctata]|nr:hypothetical protein JTB14_009465 [Gonioctena quinquepunctata]